MKDTGQRIQTEDSANEVAIKVEHVSKTFRLPHNRQNSIKGSLINLVSGGDRTYEKQEVLKDVSFEIKKGEFFGIVGRNGSGKSTLLKMLAGIYKPTAGTITVNGSLTPFIELGVGFNPELTGRENVFLNGALLGFSNKEVEAMYEDIVAFAELERFMDQKLKNYSSGMQVRLAFSIAIRAESDILLLDEVLAVGDAAFQQKCFNYFENLKKSNKTVVFVSHDMGAVRRFCTKAIYVSGGDMLAEAEASEIADRYMVDNIEAAQLSAAKTRTLKSTHSISSSLVNQLKDRVTMRFNYKTTDATMIAEDMYIGLSLMRDGVPVGEIATDYGRSLGASGVLEYTLSTSMLNPGAYQMDAALLRKSNRELLCFTKRKVKFIIAGSDDRRGASIYLDDGWRYDVD